MRLFFAGIECYCFVELSSLPPFDRLTKVLYRGKRHVGGGHAMRPSPSLIVL